MNAPLYLFCGGPAHDGEGRPKPLMKIIDGRSLIVHFLFYLKDRRPTLPKTVTLLCDDGQEEALRSELIGLSYSVPIHILACGKNANTFEKFSKALLATTDSKEIVQFGYPDIFFFDEFREPAKQTIDLDATVHISAAALTSRFPRLAVDPYNNNVKGISNYSSLVPANPLYVFGGDIWGRVDHLKKLINEFQSQEKLTSPSLEYDFFFWLVNHNKMRSVIQHGERLWIDSIRDINHLLVKTGDIK